MKNRKGRPRRRAGISRSGVRKIIKISRNWTGRAGGLRLALGGKEGGGK